MTPVRLAMGLIVGCSILVSIPAGAQEAAKIPEVRRISLSLRNTPFRQALQQVCAPGGLRVQLEANVPALPITLALKEVHEETAFRLLMRQARKQEKNLQYEATDEGYRIYVGAPAEEQQPVLAAIPLSGVPLPAIPLQAAPLPAESSQPPVASRPDLPVIQNREAEAAINLLLQRAESGEPLLPPPSSEPGIGFGGGSVGLNGFQGNSFGGTGFGFGPRGFGFANGILSEDSYRQFYPFGGVNLRGTVDPYRSPVAGGLAASNPTPPRSNERVQERKRRPYFYDHRPQWILEHRTRYWNSGGGTRRGDGKTSPTGGSGPIGGGYLPR